MRRFRLPVIVVGLLVGLVGFASAPEICLACSCLPPPEPAEARDDAAAVFAGRVSAVERRRSASGISYQQVTMQVSTVWKGTIAHETIVYTGSGGGDCGYLFEPGRDYLIYANQADDGGPPRIIPAGGLATGICSRTRPLDRAADDLAALGPSTIPADTPLPTLPNTGEGFPPTLTFSSTPSLLALLFLSAVLLGVGAIGRRRGQPD